MEYIMKIPQRYIPKTLSNKDRIKQKKMILRSRKAYTHHNYYTRKKVKSFKSKPSNHIENAKQKYGVDSIIPSNQLARKTKCSLKGLKKIVNKGEGAYYSSGSRPNQTPQSWGIARLASAITGANASKIDYSILKSECSPNSPALKIAQKP
jgi:ribosomal protein S2